MAVFTKGQRFEGLNWRPSKQAAKAEAALAAIVGLGWAPKDAISNAPQQPLQPNVTALVQELVASNGIPHQPSLNPAAISLLFELARTQRVSVTDVYETTSLGFHTCAFMWGTRRLAESDPFQRKKDAKCHAAERALAEINGELGKPETRTEQGAAQPIQDDTMQIDPSPRQPEIVPVTAAADPVVTLATLYKVQYPQDPAPPLYTEISNPAGFQYAVALNGRVVATSDVFSNKFCAKRNAAVTVLGVLSEWAQDPRKRKRLENGGESASGLNTTMDASFLSSVDGPDQWDKQLATFADLIGGSMDLKKCTNNIIMTLCLALQSYADLSVDRIVIGGPFGRGTALLCDYTIDLTLLRTRPFTAPTDAGGVSSLRDPRLHDLVAAALARSPLSACIVQTAHDARDGCVEVVYRGIQSLNVRVWEGINLVPREGVQGNLKPSQTGREGQEGNGSVGIAQLQRFQQTLQNSTAIYHVRNQSVGMKLNVEDLMAWSPTFSESNTLFFRNRSACAPLCRILRFWTLPLAFSHEHARTLGNALDLIAAYAWDSVERSVAGYDPTRVSLSFALEGALRILENAERMRVFWNEFYLRSEMQAARLAAGAPPLLLDPANPFHNIFETVSYTVWDRLAIHAREARLRLFEEILSPGVDFISAALNPVLATSTEVSYLDISLSSSARINSITQHPTSSTSCPLQPNPPSRTAKSHPQTRRVYAGFRTQAVFCRPVCSSRRMRCGPWLMRYPRMRRWRGSLTRLCRL
ncbi:hypothetical protein BC830DRAFT_1141721 [Chytriomyces sp. MP71]|nr:hypothetical protein BC830DRAFT_1141721 [Chytriomyces sp. MP71]